MPEPDLQALPQGCLLAGWPEQRRWLAPSSCCPSRTFTIPLACRQRFPCVLSVRGLGSTWHCAARRGGSCFVRFPSAEERDAALTEVRCSAAATGSHATHRALVGTVVTAAAYASG